MSQKIKSSQADLNNTAKELLGNLPERWGRMGLMSRAALVEVGCVLKKEGMLNDDATLIPGWNGGLIVCSKKGSLAVDIEYAQTVKSGPGMASPHLFGYTLPNIPLAEAAIQYGLTGPVFCMISDDPYEEALLVAQQWLEDISGTKIIMVAGALDVIPDDPKPKVAAKFKILHTE